MEINLVQNWEKYHFIVKEDIVFWIKFRKKGMQVDQDKVESHQWTTSSHFGNNVRSFLVHVGFYMQFIKDFSKVSHPLCKILEMESTINFDEVFLKEFFCLKEKLVPALIIIASDWSIAFQLMCDFSGVLWELLLVN